MKKLSLKLTDYILEKNIISIKDYDIYQYGVQIFLEIFFNVICSFAIAFLLNMVFESIIFFFFFIPLRCYYGGLHLDKYYSCLIFSCITLICILLIVKYFNATLLFSFILYLCSLVFIKLIGPINHPNKKVDAKENILLIKKANFILLICFIIALIFMFIRAKQYILLEALVYVLVFFTMLLGKMKYMKKKLSQ